MMTHTMRKDQNMLQLWQSRLDDCTPTQASGSETNSPFEESPNQFDGSRYDFMIWEQEPPQDSKFVPSTRLLDGAQAIVAAAPKYGIDPSSVPADLYAKYQAKQAQYHHFSEVRNPHNKWDDAGKLEGARVWTKIDGDYLMIHCELEIDVDLATLVPHF